MTLTQVGRAMGKDPRDALIDLVIADQGHTACIISIMAEEDVRAALAHPLVSIDTDSGAKAEDGPLSESRSHPRAWGTFARILGKYVREEKLLTLEEAIRKMTSRSAMRVGLHDRGILKPGMAADITIFDPATIRGRRDVRGPEPLLRRRPARVRQRPGGRGERRDHRRTAGASAARAGVHTVTGPVSDGSGGSEM